MIGKTLGKLAALPIRVLNIPAELADRITAPDKDAPPVVADPLRKLAEVVIEAVESIDED